jgi:hypothetical protein
VQPHLSWHSPWFRPPEKNSDQIADVIEKWVRKALSEKTAGTPQRRASR